MYFRKNVSKEKREYLLELLKQYKKEMQMTPEERKDLGKWVAAGNSPYENGDWICYEGGRLVDFVTAQRMMKEQIEWFDSLSYEEQQELLYPEKECCEVGEVGEKTFASDDRELPF